MLAHRQPFHLLKQSPSLVVTLLLAGWQCWPLRAAQFGPIDDHRFAVFRGDRTEVFLDGLIRAYESLVNIGRTAVFRPTTLAIEGVAAVIFGITPNGVFYFVFLKYTVTLILVGVLARQVLVLVSAPNAVRVWAREGFVFSIVVAVASINAWHGIVPRTGPSESLVAIGLLVAAISFLRLSTSENPNAVNAFLLFLGVIICAGAKESGIASVTLLVFASRPLIVLSARSNALKVGVILGVLTCAVFPVHAILFTILEQPDLYGSVRGPSTVIQSLSQRVTSQMFLVLILAVLVVRGSVQRASPYRRVILTFVTALVLIWIMDGAIYELDSPNLRYRMVYQTISVLVVGSALVSALVTNLRFPRQLVAAMVAFFFAVNVLAFPVSGAQTLRDVNQATAEVTSTYWSDVETLANVIRKGEQQPVVLFSFDAAASYEAIVALSTYLRYLDISSPIAVINGEPSDEVVNSSEWLAVQDMQTNGRSSLISPLTKISISGWVCVGLSYTLDNPNGLLYELVKQKCDSVQRI